MRPFTVITVLFGLGACDLGPESGRVGRDAPPPAAVLAPGRDVPLLDKLGEIEAEIDLAMDNEPARVLTAEAMTDQLLHAPRDIDWLATGYSVEARLRQIQAKADAIVAMMRRGATLAAVQQELAVLRADVQDLRRQLQLPGGGPAPPTLETLLAQDPMEGARATVRAAPAAPATPSPVGAPVTPAAESPATPAPATPAPAAPETPATPPPPPPAGQPLGTPIPDGAD